MFHDLDIPARFQAVIAIPEELVPVGYTAEELADVDKVELVGGVCPGKCDVVDFEDAVWGDEGGLDGGEVDAGDAGARILVGGVSAERRLAGVQYPSGRNEESLHRPDTCSCADIEDFLDGELRIKSVWCCHTCGFSIGARCSFPSSVRKYMWWARSCCAFATSSFGP